MTAPTAAEQAAADQAAAARAAAAAEQAAADRAAAEQAAAEQAAAAGVDVGTVGAFTRVDPITGGTDAGVGVVVQVANVLFVAPLAGHWVQVDPADFQPLTAADFG